MPKLLHLLVSAMVIGVPAAGLAQFSDKGDHVEVKKGTRLCSSLAVDGVQRTVDQRRIFLAPRRITGEQDVSVLAKPYRGIDRDHVSRVEVDDAGHRQAWAIAEHRDRLAVE